MRSELLKWLRLIILQFYILVGILLQVEDFGLYLLGWETVQ